MTTPSQTTELLVIDPAVANASALLDGRRANIEILHLTPHGSALQQIAAYLEGRHGVAALHILSHGEPGALLLAGETIDVSALETQYPALIDIAGALAPQATVLLYGCSVAAEQAGRRFLDHLEATLGVNVAASAEPVGAAALGGGWILQSQRGVSDNLAFIAAARASYAGLLATATLTAGDDTPTLSAGDDTVTVDIANALGASDVIDGQDGADRLDISAAQTVVLGAASLTNVETIAITAGIQNITTNDATVGAAQTLAVDASASTSGLTWNGAAETDGAFSITGSTVADRLTGGAGNDTLTGGAGNDTLSGGDGNDELYGDTNNDTLYGGAGVDTLSGGDGNDFMYAGADNDVIYGNAGNDGISGDLGNDTIWGGDGNDTIIGGDGEDSISGDAGNDWLWGQGGNDSLYGDIGNDTISGNDGNDTLFGGDGNDTLSGGAGIDTLYGDAGNDTFSASAADFDGDTVADFAVGDSIIVVGGDLSALNGTAASGTITVGTGQTLTLTGISAASGTFAASYSGGNTTITLNAAPPNNAPVISSNGAGAAAAVNAAENQTAVTTATATDADSDTLTYSITGGTDQAKFSINAGTGALTFASAPDFETPTDSDSDNAYVVDVTVSDGNGGTDVQTITVTVTDVNENAPPPDSGPSTPPVTTTSVDGVSVQSQTTVNSATGMTQQTITVPIISTTRNDDATTPNPALADITLGVTGTTTQPAVALTVSLPNGTGMSATGTATPLSGQQAVRDLIGRIEQVTTSGSSTQTDMTGGGSSFLDALGDRSLLTRTVVPTSTTGSSSAPTTPVTIVVSGGTGSVVVQDPNSPTTATAVGLVIDARQLPAQSVIQLDNVEFAAIVGAATVTGGGGQNYVVGDDANQFIMLGAGDDTLSGGAGDDTVGSAGGNDQIFGGTGNDTVFGGDGNDRIDGGADRDILQLSAGGRTDYTMRIESGALVVTQRGSGSDGTDTVTNVEAIRFTDSQPDLSADGTLTRLYDALFDRAPDQAGKAHWLNQSASGTSLHDIASAFLASVEAQQLHGTTSNAQFVDQLYQLALGRSADAAGRSYWIDMLDSGQADRAQVLLSFANSEEKLASESVASELDFNQSDVATLVRMYDTLFDRRPDQNGINYWIAASETGTATRDIAAAFVTSEEAQALHGAMSNAQYVAMLYKTGLGRDGSAEEIAAWAHQLDNAVISRGEALLGFADSAEKIGLVGVISTSIETL